MEDHSGASSDSRFGKEDLAASHDHAEEVGHENVDVKPNARQEV